MISKNGSFKEIPIVLSSSDEYSIYIPVLLNALKENANQDCQYNIYVLDSGISDGSKTVVSAYVATLGNFSIHYIDVDYYVQKYKDLWFICAHFSVATYVRFFMPELLPELDKVLFLDLDIVVEGDISELYDIDIGDNAIGAAVDACYERETYYDKDGLVEYNKNVVRYPLEYKAFNAGVLIVNLKKWRELNITEKCIQRLAEIKTPRVLDQCILNSLFCNGLVYELPAQWNYQWHADVKSIKYPTTSQKMNEVIESYQNAKSNPKIIHYTTPTKPWNIYCEPLPMRNGYVLDVALASFWWRYAPKTPFYEKIIMRNILISEENLRKLINGKNDEISKLSQAVDRLYYLYGSAAKEKVCLLGALKIREYQDTKLFYLLGIKIGKRVKDNEYKSVYLFNIPIYKKKLK